MIRKSALRPVTNGEIAVLPWRDRPAALAGGGLRPEPLLRLVEDQPGRPAQFPDADLVLTLRVAAELGEAPVVAGTVVVAERARYLAAPTQLGTSAAGQERLMVIDRLWLSKGVDAWRPPLGALLVATAAMIVATVAHDGHARTCVACRVEPGDDVADDAAETLGARDLETVASRKDAWMWPGVARVDDLRFLDGRAAAAAARMVLDHLDRSTVPCRELAVGDAAGRGIEAVMSLSFPRAVSALRDEIGDIAAGTVRLDWRRPAVPMNDVAEYLRRAAVPVGA
jgi:hypothetical protein